MRHVFGPVSSRRLGQSLGVDPIAFKTCNWNCVYCQLGRSVSLHRSRKDFVSVDDVVTDVAEALASHDLLNIDWITFGGSGEPTLNASLGRMIREVKGMTEIPVAVLTNGSLLYLPEVQVDLIMADAVLTKLDAGTEDLYYRINRPLPELIFDRFVRGLQAFRRVYGGTLFIEVMLIAGINDSEEALRDTAAVLERLRPDEIHVTTPSRPPAEPWVNVPGDDALARAAAILGPRARVVSGPAAPLDLSGRQALDDAVLAILERHPMSLEDLTEALRRRTPGHVDAALARLGETGRVREVVRAGRTFWAPANGRYGWGPLGPGGNESNGPQQALARQQP